jgi:hypothetical protein
LRRIVLTGLIDKLGEREAGALDAALSLLRLTRACRRKSGQPDRLTSVSNEVIT